MQDHRNEHANAFTQRPISRMFDCPVTCAFGNHSLGNDCLPPLSENEMNKIYILVVWRKIKYQIESIIYLVSINCNVTSEYSVQPHLEFRLWLMTMMVMKILSLSSLFYSFHSSPSLLNTSHYNSFVRATVEILLDISPFILLKWKSGISHYHEWNFFSLHIILLKQSRMCGEQS